MIDSSTRWQSKYLKSISASYGKFPHFKEFFPALEKILLKNQKHLAALNLELIILLKDYFKIDTPCFTASDIVKTELTGSDLILELCLTLGANTYMSGPDGKNYLKLEKFKEFGIEVVFHDYEHPVYPQKHGDSFIPYLSACDYIFNNGGVI